MQPMIGQNDYRVKYIVADDSDGYIEAVYASEAAAEAAKLAAIRKAIADGEDVYYDPDTEESFDHWDHDWRVEEWNVVS